jgi:hypothetical protein
MGKHLPHPVSAQHWDMLKAFREKNRHPTLELDDFLSFWDVTNQELADICECSLSTVERWFLNPNSPNQRDLSEEYKQRLALAHYLWLSKTNPELAHKLNQLDELYEKVQPKFKL